MAVFLRPLRIRDAEAIVAAEDHLTVRWLSGGTSTVEGTQAYVERLRIDAEKGSTKRAFGTWVDDACVGIIDYSLEDTDGLEPGDVNIAYGVAPWVRAQGVATEAVVQVCELLRGRRIGTRAAIRADPRNPASARVAEKAGITQLEVDQSSIELDEGVNRVVFRIFVRDLRE